MLYYRYGDIHLFKATKLELFGFILRESLVLAGLACECSRVSSHSESGQRRRAAFIELGGCQSGEGGFGMPPTLHQLIENYDELLFDTCIYFDLVCW